jgi:hypothetical protein
VKFILASMKSLTNCVIPTSESLFRLSDSRLCLYKLFRNPPVIQEIFPKAGYECTLEKSTNKSKGKQEQKFNAANGTIFRISKWFQRRNQKRLWN